MKEKGGGRVGVVHIKCRSKWGGSSVCEAATLLGGPPEVRGAGAESGFDQIGSAPAPGQKNALLFNVHIFCKRKLGRSCAKLSLLHNVGKYFAF